LPVIFRHLLIIFDMVLFTFIFKPIIPEAFTSYLQFFGYAIIVFLIITAVITGEFLLFSQGTKDFLLRLKAVATHKI